MSSAAASSTPGTATRTQQLHFKLLLQRCVADIVAELVSSLTSNKDVNLSQLRKDISRKHKLPSQPRLVDIIAGKERFEGEGKGPTVDQRIM